MRSKYQYQEDASYREEWTLSVTFLYRLIFTECKVDLAWRDINTDVSTSDACVH